MATHAEKDYFHLNVSIRKALKGLETPLKSKHARSVIIIIHRSKESLTFWSLITRQPIMESRFTAWHFCHLLHKVLREAHRCVLQQSQKHKKMILEIGKSWGHLQDDIGNCIKAYSKLLVTKLNFHDKNRFYPGNLIITFASIANAADNDLNYYFQLCVEIFDYLDDIVLLQIAIFTSINTYRISSMTQPGQCRLAPMITLIQDSNPLYDMSVRLMFKLHEKLPNDVLSGHRERFSGIFAKLKLFYDNVRPLQYFHDLITVPQLPEHSPNFQSQVDFGSYVPPVVLVQSEPDPVVEDLVDTNSPNNSDHIQQDHILNERVNELENLLEDKSDMIDQLNAKICEWKSNFDGLEQSYKHDVLELQRSNTALSNDLASSKEIIANIRMEKDDLELQLTNNPILIQKVVEEEEKQKLSSEKFNKLKLMYTQIRDEHINLLRQHGEHSKSLNKEKQVNSELQLQIKELNNEIVKEAEASLILLNEEKLVSEKLFLDMQQNQKQLEGDLLEALNRVESLTKSNKQSEDKFETMRKLTIQTVKETCASTLNDGDQQALEVVPKLSAEIDTLLNKLKSSSHIPIDDCIEKIHDILYLGYYFIELYEQCDIIYITTKEIEKGLDVFNKIRSIWPDLIQLFEIIENNDNKQQFANVANGTQSKLTELNALVQGILNNFENSVDLDKLIEIELKEMDAAIEEAASKLIDLLSKSRENDNKIKLEVNEKILEACTALMENIKILNIKSRTLQKEIVSSQKGNATANEFYKRNSQWSDGLISASKSVAKAANCLVEAANNAVNSDSGQNFDLIVAAQEISACTVQLVMASKVKANRNSENLTNLTNASRNVTKATGVVVATVKDGNSRQEQQNDIDLYKLTPSQLKTMEMEIQVKVLELEQALQSQRIKLSSFRKEHYQKTEY
ncbi:GH16831 [Drosophila grimshawi]|uniref:GH16831 n=1 Tax=Drosophila grimshawi TaxID=7222 RepID=B4IWY2_DROGR|nr:GH16831 [Drosophila grimshawi]